MENQKKSITKIIRKNGHFNCFNKICRHFEGMEGVKIEAVLPFQFEIDDLNTILGNNPIHIFG